MILLIVIYFFFFWFVGLPCAVISTKWLICLFAEVLPTETVLRIWDCVFNEGYKVTQNVQIYFDKSYLFL